MVASIVDIAMHPNVPVLALVCAAQALGAWVPGAWRHGRESPDAGRPWCPCGAEALSYRAGREAMEWERRG
ncbi:hypothetical protein [Profundibacterium mesophilum]|nr:hypothetical protein [Profundibacterium mesophilum]